MRSYFHESVDSPKTVQLVQHITDLETIIVGSELEALILEMNLIKKHRPKYNIRLKDDKRYPYIKVHYADPFPKVTVTRRMDDDGSKYFGPYTSVWAVHQTLDVLRKIFPYLSCDRVITGTDPRACLYCDIKLCLAPCIGLVNREQYRAMIDELCRFLRGHTEGVVARLKADMLKASEDLEFEKAAALRDQLVAIERVVSADEEIVLAWYDFADPFVLTMPPGYANRPIGVFSTFFPARSAQVTLNGQVATGSVWPEMRGDRQSSSACLAWSETWVKPKA